MEPFGLRCWDGLPGKMRGAHAHNEMEINFVARGGLTYLFGGAPVALCAGQLAVFWATVPHQLVALEADTALRWVTVPLATFLGWQMPRAFVRPLLEGYVSIEPDTGDQRISRDAALLAEWQADLASESAERRRIVLLQLEARLRRLALACESAPQAHKPASLPGELGRVEKMTAFMAENYAAPLKTEEIAQAGNVHPNYAMNLFRREFGTSLGDFLTRYRISHAQRLLATTENSVQTIAFDCGFGSVSRFHAAFKSICGTSPAQYRRALRCN